MRRWCHLGILGKFPQNGPKMHQKCSNTCLYKQKILIWRNLRVLFRISKPLVVSRARKMFRNVFEVSSTGNKQVQNVSIGATTVCVVSICQHFRWSPIENSILMKNLDVIMINQDFFEKSRIFVFFFTNVFLTSFSVRKLRFKHLVFLSKTQKDK